MNIGKPMRIFFPVILLLAIACNNQRPGTRDETARKETVQSGTTASQDPAVSGLVALDSTSGNNGDYKQKSPGRDKQEAPGNTDWDKKIVKNASITLEVKDYRQCNDMVHATIRQFGGYVAQEEQNESGYKIENNITIKVPVDQFDKAVGSLTTDSEKVITKKITSEDVTGEVVDTKSRMEAKREVRQRYMELLKQARNMNDILQVQHEINDIQEQIEAAGGRINYLSHAATFSTIQLTFYQVLNEQAKEIRDPGFGDKVLTALKNGGEWIGELFILLLNLWPLWAFIFIAALGYRKWRVSNPRAPKTMAPVTEKQPEAKV